MLVAIAIGLSLAAGTPGGSCARWQAQTREFVAPGVERFRLRPSWSTSSEGSEATVAVSTSSVVRFEEHICGSMGCVTWVAYARRVVAKKDLPRLFWIETDQGGWGVERERIACGRRGPAATTALTWARAGLRFIARAVERGEIMRNFEFSRGQPFVVAEGLELRLVETVVKRQAEPEGGEELQIRLELVNLKTGNSSRFAVTPDGMGRVEFEVEGGRRMRLSPRAEGVWLIEPLR